ncbi:MAG: zinc ribbon domain-containing protein [Ignisphaera sp.]
MLERMLRRAEASTRGCPSGSTGEYNSHLEYKALEKGLEAVHASPRKTSSRCPRCRSS